MIKRVFAAGLVAVLLSSMLAAALPAWAADPSATEVVSERTQYSNTYDVYGGSRITVIRLGSINYESPDGGFLPIQTNVLPSPKAEWDWEVETGHWQLYVNNDMTVQVVKADNTIGHRIYGLAYQEPGSKKFELILTAEATQPVIAGDTIVWPDVMYGVDYQLRYTNDSFKEDVIIHQELRDLLNTPGYAPADYGLDDTALLVVVYVMDWSESLPLKIKTDKDKDGKADKGPDGRDILETVMLDRAIPAQNIYFQSSKKDKYFDTDLVSFFPLDYAVSDNPTNPDADLAAGEEYIYAKEPIQKWFTKKSGVDYMLAGISLSILNQMPGGTIIFDPTETLRPSGAGTYTQNTLYGSAGTNWESMDDVSPDGITTSVGFSSNAPEPGVTKIDQYDVPASSSSGAINSVTVYIRSSIQYIGYGMGGFHFTRLRTYGTNYEGSQVSLTGHISVPYQTWTLSSTEYTVNPNTTNAWTWGEVDAIEIGIKLKARDDDGDDTAVVRGTQSYVVIDYTVLAVPTVTTQAATNINATTATGNGNITDTGGENADERGVVWDIATQGAPGDVAPGASGYASENHENGDYGTGAYALAITGLAQGTPYYVRAYAHNSEGYAYGDEVSFTTDDVPAVTTDEATDVAYTTATVHSTLDWDGGEANEVRFNYYEVGGAFGDFTTSWVSGYTTGQQPSVDLIGLTPNKQHFFRVEAKNSLGTTNGSSKTFTTLNAVLDPTDFIAYPEGTRVVLEWVKGSGSTETIVRAKEGGYPTGTADGVLVYSGVLSDAAYEDLDPGTTYYFSAWGKSGSTYSAASEDVMATTTAETNGVDEATAPSVPSTWFQTPDYAELASLPLYTQVNAFADALDIPRTSFWLMLALGQCALAGILIMVWTKRLQVALIVTGVVLLLNVFLFPLLPLWMVAFAGIFFFGAVKTGGGSGV